MSADKRILKRHGATWPYKSAIGDLKGFGYWAVDEEHTNEFVGCVGLWQSPGWPELELGHWLVKNSSGKATH